MFFLVNMSHKVGQLVLFCGIDNWVVG